MFGAVVVAEEGMFTIIFMGQQAALLTLHFPIRFRRRRMAGQAGKTPLQVDTVG
jgi:hypothetical protein